MASTLFTNLNGRALSSSQQAVQYLQAKYGTETAQFQAIRYQYYSFVRYPEAGSSTFQFFTSIQGTGDSATFQLTNMPQAGSFGNNHFLILGIKSGLYIKTWDTNAWGTIATADQTTLVSDLLFGFVNAGYFSLQINSKDYCQIPEPFLTMPPAQGQTELYTAGIKTLTMAEAAPNTVDTYVSPAPYATLSPEAEAAYVIEPGLFIEAQQTFTASLNFPTGVVPIVGTAVTDDTTNPLYVGFTLDGIVLRPVG